MKSPKKKRKRPGVRRIRSKTATNLFFDQKYPIHEYDSDSDPEEQFVRSFSKDEVSSPTHHKLDPNDEPLPISTAHQSQSSASDLELTPQLTPQSNELLPQSPEFPPKSLILAAHSMSNLILSSSIIQVTITLNCAELEDLCGSHFSAQRQIAFAQRTQLDLTFVCFCKDELTKSILKYCGRSVFVSTARKVSFSFSTRFRSLGTTRQNS